MGKDQRGICARRRRLRRSDRLAWGRPNRMSWRVGTRSTRRYEDLDAFIPPLQNAAVLLSETILQENA